MELYCGTQIRWLTRDILFVCVSSEAALKKIKHSGLTECLTFHHVLSYSVRHQRLEFLGSRRFYMGRETQRITCRYDHHYPLSVRIEPVTLL